MRQTYERSKYLVAFVLAFLIMPQTASLPIIVQAEQTAGNDDLIDPLFVRGKESSFPSIPLTIQTAAMCDKDLNPYQRNKAVGGPKLAFEWIECPEDKTCLKCPSYQQQYGRNVELTSAFRDPSAKQQRQQLYKEIFHDVPYNMVLVMGVNFGQIHFWLNWVCSADALGIDVRRFVVMAPSDERAKRVIEDAGFIAIDLSWQKKLAKPIAVEYKGCSNCLSTGHGDINNIVTLLAGELVDAGYNTMTQDVDFVWIKDPRPYLKQALRGRDVMASDAQRYDAASPGNTGFVFYVSNYRTKIFINSLCNIIPLKLRSDQLLFNQMLRHPKLRSVSFAMLPRAFSMQLHSLRDWKNDALIVHAVGDRKEDALVKSGGVHYTKECSVYIPTLWPCGPNPEKCWEGAPALAKYTVEESNTMRAQEHSRQQKTVTTSHLTPPQVSCTSMNTVHSIKHVSVQSQRSGRFAEITIVPRVNSAFLQKFAREVKADEKKLVTPPPWCKTASGEDGGDRDCITRKYAKDPNANICGPCQCHGCKLVTPAGAGFDAGPSLKLAFVLDPVKRFVAAFAELYIHRKVSPFGPVAPKDLVKGAALQQQFDKFTDAYIAGKIPDEPSFSKHYPGPFTAQLGYISHHDYDFIGLGGTEKFADEWNGIIHEKYGMPLMGDNHREQLSSSDNSFGITVSGKQHRMLCLVYARDYCCIAPLAANIPPECMGPDESNDPVAWCKTAAKTPNIYSWLQ